ncbi:hypothetical protein ACFW5V_31985 [Streptomyces sp. NPDC058762]|uniref:hypothetical protein n=1 Tax=Streptomyces sp. NPDC058762 TaxID=3346629 RepID=UPI0036CF6D77
MTSTTTWLEEMQSLASPSLRVMQYESRLMLNRLAEDRALLTFLVHEIPHHPERLAASRVTLLLNRLSLYQAPDRSFEIRLNMQPRPDNQLVPHDHCYTFATRILTGGYVHVVRRRTNGWSGPFTGDDLEPAVVTVERPGSAYTLGHTMVHQAVMEPDTVTLFVRGPRRKATSHAAEGFMPSKDTWPAPAAPDEEAVESRPATLAEYERMRDYLIQRRLID